MKSIFREENFSHQKTEIKPQVDLYKIDNGKEIIVLAEVDWLI